MDGWYNICAAAGMVVLLMLVSWLPALLGFTGCSIGHCKACSCRKGRKNERLDLQDHH